MRWMRQCASVEKTAGTGAAYHNRVKNSGKEKRQDVHPAVSR
jgi:hypothetical protein